jgi:hypothetical protein
MRETIPNSLDRRVAAWGLAGLLLAIVQFHYGMALHLGDFLVTVGGSDVGGYVRMSDFPSLRAALTFAGDRAMGFPIFLYGVRLVFGPSITAMCWALFAVHVVAAGVFYAALRHRWGLHPVALALLIAHPGLVAYTTAPMTDTFATDLVMLALAGVVTGRLLWAASAFGWVALVRPPTLVLGVVVLGWLVLQQRTLRSALAVAVFALVVGWQAGNCWRVYGAPCLVTPTYSANTLGWGLNLGRSNVRIYFSQHMPGEEVLVADPWLAAHAGEAAPLWLAPRLVWFARHPGVFVVTLLKKTVALLDVRTRSVDERPGHAVDATPRWYRWWARLWAAAACGGVALALIWVWDPRWTAVALVALVHYAMQSPLHVPARYGLTAVPCALVLLVWTAQCRSVYLALAVFAAVGFFWQVSAWDRIDPTLGKIEAAAR